MQPDELDRLLSDEPVIAPSPGFAQAVMSEIRRDVEAFPKIEFPWKPTLGALATATIGAAAAFSVGLSSSASGESIKWTLAVDWFERSASHFMTAGTSATAGSLALGVLCMLVPMAVYELVLRIRDRGPFRLDQV